MTDDTLRCSECHGLATPCESCPHGEGDVLCANPQCDHHGEHVPPMNTTDDAITERLECLRRELREAAGVPEHEDEDA